MRLSHKLTVLLLLILAISLFTAFAMHRADKPAELSVYMTVATDLPSSPAVQEDFFFAYDTDGTLCKVFKPKSGHRPDYDASDRLVEDMLILVDIRSKKEIGRFGSDEDRRAPVYEISASFIQGGYTPVPGGEEITGGRWFLSTVISVNEQFITVSPRPGSEEAKEYSYTSPLTVMLKELRPDLGPGDSIMISYSGMIESGVIASAHSIIEKADEWHAFGGCRLGTAVYDIDNDGIDEICGLGFGPTSGLFTFTVTVWEIDAVEYKSIFCTEHYALSLVENEDGTIQVRGETYGENPVVHYFDISIENGNVILSENGELLPYWGS